MADTKLLPCPFCGGSRTTVSGGWVDCDDCQAEGPYIGATDGQREKAIAAWNRRPAPVLTPKQEAADELFDALTKAEWALKDITDFLRIHGYDLALISSAVAPARAALTKAGQP